MIKSSQAAPSEEIIGKISEVALQDIFSLIVDWDEEVEEANQYEVPLE